MAVEVAHVVADFTGDMQRVPEAPVDPFETYVDNLLNAIRGVRLVAQQRINALEAEVADLKRQLAAKG